MSLDGRPPTIYDVARLAGLSHQSVSRVLRDVPGIRDDTRERVHRAVEALDYRPSVVARELANSRRSRIGVVGYESFEASTAKVLRGINEVASREGFTLEIVSLDPLGDVDDIAQRVAAINAMDIAGVLATSPTRSVRSALQRTVFRVPVHFEADPEGDAPGRSRAATLAVQHLLDLGHTRIGHLAGPQEWDSARGRRRVWQSMLNEHALQPGFVVEGDWSAASGYAAMRDVALDDGTTAIFAANDRMALGALRALAEREIRVPTDVSVVGIDDIPEAEYFSPPLTTVHVDFEGAGRAAAEALIAQIRDPHAPSVPRAARKLTIRASSSQPRSL